MRQELAVKKPCEPELTRSGHTIIRHHNKLKNNMHLQSLDFTTAFYKIKVMDNKDIDNKVPQKVESVWTKTVQMPSI